MASQTASNLLDKGILGDDNALGIAGISLLSPEYCVPTQTVRRTPQFYSGVDFGWSQPPGLPSPPSEYVYLPSAATALTSPHCGPNVVHPLPSSPALESSAFQMLFTPAYSPYTPFYPPPASPSVASPSPMTPVSELEYPSPYLGSCLNPCPSSPYAIPSPLLSPSPMTSYLALADKKPLTPAVILGLHSPSVIDTDKEDKFQFVDVDPAIPASPKQRSVVACEHCHLKKRGCSKGMPCARCKRCGIECVPQKPRIPKKSRGATSR